MIGAVLLMFAIVFWPVTLAIIIIIIILAIWLFRPIKSTTSANSKSNSNDYSNYNYTYSDKAGWRNTERNSSWSSAWSRMNDGYDAWEEEDNFYEEQYQRAKSEYEQAWRDYEKAWYEYEETIRQQGEYYEKGKEERDKQFWKTFWEEHDNAKKRKPNQKALDDELHSEKKKHQDKNFEDEWRKYEPEDDDSYSVNHEKYYNLLGIPTTATSEEIKERFRELALKYHPDKSKNKTKAEEKFKQILHAYEMITQKKKAEATA